VGLSAGSMVMAPNVGEEFVGWNPPTGGDRTLGVVDFLMFPHLDQERLPENTLAHAERWAAKMPGPGYAIDDQTAIRVTDGGVGVVSEGHWKLFTPLILRDSAARAISAGSSQSDPASGSTNSDSPCDR
jgi:dipeptidase E